VICPQLPSVSENRHAHLFLLFLDFLFLLVKGPSLSMPIRPSLAKGALGMTGKHVQGPDIAPRNDWLRNR